MNKLSGLFILILCNVSFAYDGIEECHNATLGIHSVAHRGISYRWEYSYKNIKYPLDAASWYLDDTPLQVEHVSESLVSYKCDKQILIERRSARHIILKDLHQNTVIEGLVNCVGAFASGMPEQIFNDYNPCENN